MLLLCYYLDLIDSIKRFELRILAVCMVLLGSAAAWLLLTRPVHRIEGDFLEREDNRQIDGWLRKMLVSPVAATRRRAMLALGRIGNPDTLEFLITATRDPSPRVRAMAAFAIGQMEDARTVTVEGRIPRHEAARALSVLLGDVERGVVAYAVEALGKMHWRNSLGALINTPAPLPVTLTALTRMKAKETVPWIVELLRSDDQDVRCAAVNALNHLDADIDGVLTNKLVKRVSDRNWKVRIAALKILAHASPEQKVVRAILAATKDRNPQVRIAAYNTLGAIRPSGIVDTLANGLEDANVNVRIASVRALGEVAGRRALRLVQSLRFRSEPLSYAAEEAMAKLAEREEDYFSGLTDFPRQYASEAGRESFLKALETLAFPRAERLIQNLKSDHFNTTKHEIERPRRQQLQNADYQRISRELNRRLMVYTTIGVFELAVHYDEARLVADHFIGLVEHGAFEMQRFTAVDSTRLVEFRAARPVLPELFPERVRCEINTEFFTRGSVGMFSDPKDSGGYRFFIALSDLPEFNGMYTNFGHLISGDNLINRITRETRILRITRQ